MTYYIRWTYSKYTSRSRWKEEAFEEMDSTLVVQQYIQQTIRQDPKGNNSQASFFSFNDVNHNKQMLSVEFEKRGKED